MSRDPQAEPCPHSPHFVHEYQIIEAHSPGRNIFVIWAVCKWCLKKERV